LVSNYSGNISQSPIVIRLHCIQYTTFFKNPHTAISNSLISLSHNDKKVKPFYFTKAGSPYLLLTILLTTYLSYPQSTLLPRKSTVNLSRGRFRASPKYIKKCSTCKSTPSYIIISAKNIMQLLVIYIQWCSVTYIGEGFGGYPPPKLNSIYFMCSSC